MVRLSRISFFTKAQTAAAGVLMICSALLLSGCAQQPTNSWQASVDERINNIESGQQSGYASLADKMEQLNQNQSLMQSVCVAHLTEINQNQQTLLARDSKLLEVIPEPVTEPDCPSVARTQVQDKLVVGALERIYLPSQNVYLETRVDTGAETSSLGITDLTFFERDGKQWLQFTLPGTPSQRYWEYPIKRRVKIRQQGRLQPLTRPVIEMLFQLGERQFSGEFSLADRRHLQYQALLGRSFLKDIAIVDVAEAFMISEPSEHSGAQE